MRKIIILLLCCGVLASMAGCGGSTAPPPTESPPTTVSETIITETPTETIPPVTAVEPTEKNKKPLKKKIPQLQKEIEELKSITVNVEKFISIAKKYTDLQELTPEILRTFISKIVIHERAQKWKKTSEQQIDIYFQYIGSIPETPIEKAG